MKKGAFLVTFIGLQLPYRLRIYYGFLLNFILAPLNRIKQLGLILNQIILFILLFFVYYLVLPLTYLFKPKSKRSVVQKLDEKLTFDNLFRMF